MQYCSLQHRTLLPSPVTSTAGCCFRFGSVSSFFLKLFLYSSPVAYLAPTDLGSSSFSVLSLGFFIVFMRFSRQEYWSGFPFPSAVDHKLSEISTMTHLSWVALHCMAHSFIELDKAVVHVIRLFSFLWLWFSDSALWRMIRGLWKLPSGRDWLRGKLGLVLMGRAMLSKSLFQFSVDRWSCVPSLLFTWGQTMVEVMKIMVTSFKRSHGWTATLCTLGPAAGPHWPTPPLESPGHPQASPGQSPVGSLLLSPGPGAQASAVPSESLFPRPV